MENFILMIFILTGLALFIIGLVPVFIHRDKKGLNISSLSYLIGSFSMAIAFYMMLGSGSEKVVGFFLVFICCGIGINYLMLAVVQPRLMKWLLNQLEKRRNR